MRLFGYRVFPRWSPPGEISEHGCWTWSDGGWLYIHDHLPGLYWQMLTQWRSDRHLCG